MTMEKSEMIQEPTLSGATSSEHVSNNIAPTSKNTTVDTFDVADRDDSTFAFIDKEEENSIVRDESESGNDPTISNEVAEHSKLDGTPRSGLMDTSENFNDISLTSTDHLLIDSSFNDSIRVNYSMDNHGSGEMEETLDTIISPHEVVDCILNDDSTTLLVGEQTSNDTCVKSIKENSTLKDEAEIEEREASTLDFNSTDAKLEEITDDIPFLDSSQPKIDTNSSIKQTDDVYTQDDAEIKVEKNPKPTSAGPRSIEIVEDDLDDEEEFEDETIMERVIALKEMFPESTRNMTCDIASKAKVWSIKLFKISKVVMWIAVSSASVGIFPAILEQERVEIMVAQEMQRNQILLGPSAATAR